ncbi:IclR family transcriptional regulator [Bryobacter aggregatus]|uniref:IclR family transcriptional regulator n=1 Tax=Bryobacter aggregatus TaxID=360054 RepID=UPI000A91CA47|nr:IclR family transcriptional regulator [Bryobacter aggregatus]
MRYLIPVLQSAFRIIDELSRQPGLNLNEAAIRTGVPKSTVFRVLMTLQHLQIVDRDADKAYRLVGRVPGLWSAHAATEILRRAALPAMIRLRDLLGETVNLGVLEQDKIVYLEVVPSESALRFSERPGATVPVHSSSLGRAILAHSSAATIDAALRGRPLVALTARTITDEGKLRAEIALVGRQGYSIEIEENALQATCAGAPIFNREGVVVAALSISGLSHRFQPASDKRILKALKKATHDIEGAL